MARRGASGVVSTLTPGTAVGGNSRPRLLQEPPRLRREAPPTTARCCDAPREQNHTASDVSMIGRSAPLLPAACQHSQYRQRCVPERAACICAAAGDEAQGEQCVVDLVDKGLCRTQLLLRQTRSNCGSPTTSQCISRICGSVVGGIGTTSFCCAHRPWRVQ
ncbi:uncharacterized protein BKA78DRAFT_86827 [Phyllosticta capitalensis]|uniref:uncharacterized protein n=1 Tax=Phyllosticta capitalensis TaxID=121624 RepID=UPI00312DF850